MTTSIFDFPTTGVLAGLQLVDQLNNAFAAILTNNASVTPPTDPVLNQFWYNPDTNVLSVYNGTAFVALSTSVPFVGVQIISGATTVSSVQFGAVIEAQGSSSYDVTLPDPATYTGANIAVYNNTNAASPVTAVASSGAITGVGTSEGNLTLPYGSMALFISDGYNWLSYSNAGYALLGGSSAQVFDVATASGPNNAIPLSQAQGTFAGINGNSSETFAVADAAASQDAVNLGQLSGLFPTLSGDNTLAGNLTLQGALAVPASMGEITGGTMPSGATSAWVQAAFSSAYAGLIQNYYYNGAQVYSLSRSGDITAQNASLSTVNASTLTVANSLTANSGAFNSLSSPNISGVFNGTLGPNVVLPSGNTSNQFTSITVTEQADIGNLTVTGSTVLGIANVTAGTSGSEAINYTQISTGNGSLVGYNQGGTGAVEMTVQSKLQQNLNILDFGADPTGANDSTGAIQDAINALGSAGGTVWVPPGAWLVAGALTLSVGVTLKGTMTGPFSNITSSTYQNYPMLLITSTSDIPFTMANEDSHLVNLAFYYPDQVSPTASTPTAYPLMINLGTNSNGGNTVENCTSINAYTGVAGNLARGCVKNCWIGAYNEGVIVDYTEDYAYLENVFFQVMWDIFEGLSYPQSIDTWVADNNAALQIKRADGIKGNNLGFFGQGTAIILTDSSDTSLSTRCGYGTFVNVDIDTCSYGVNAISTNQSGRGFSFIGTGMGATNTNITLSTGGTQAPLVYWYSGFSRKATSAYTINAGTLLIERVDGINALTGTTASDGITAPSVPANDASITNPFPFAVMVYIWGGVVGTIGINNQAITVTSSDVNESVRLGVGDEIALGYTTAPSWAWFRA